MKAVIIGGGSIGKRHATNLESLNIKTKIIDIDEINNIESILNEGFDFGFVCTPNIHHVEHCTVLAQHNIPIFCEKPFYTDKKGVDELLYLVEQNNINTMVGCNLRFTPEVQNIDANTKYINSYHRNPY